MGRNKLKMEERGTLFAWPVAMAHAWGKDYQVDWGRQMPEKGEKGCDDQPPWLQEFGVRRWSTPLSTPTLHRKFGELEPEAGPIIKFANKYGLLGFPVSLYTIGVKDRRGKIHAIDRMKSGDGERVIVRAGEGESLRRWQREIATMAVWLGIWDLITQSNAGKLGHIIKWPHRDRVVLDVALRRERGTFEVFPSGKDDPPYLYQVVADIRFEAEWAFKRWRMGDVIEPAQYALHCKINEKLKERVYLHLAWPHFESLEPFMMPKSLLSAMWLMFMWEVIGATAALRCPVCGDWVRRSNASQKTCSLACKQQKYRNKLRNRKEAQHER